MAADGKHPDFSEHPLPSGGGYSGLSEWQFPSGERHPDFSERQFPSGGGHSDFSERQLPSGGRHPEFSERPFPSGGGHPGFSERLGSPPGIADGRGLSVSTALDTAKQPAQLAVH